ncbi:hypothetical protein AOQ84DRAFT_67413 [Glonium stellatum]|uniref:Uncharacterized protein n=1 Tax=Glonium stellatum TaxID=574774 RepID=A0A8E2EYE9_9PEZI|nr:hypothetical protein AOQ84DRAFT_67413 [Glonium stellatum]
MLVPKSPAIRSGSFNPRNKQQETCIFSQHKLLLPPNSLFLRRHHPPNRKTSRTNTPRSTKSLPLNRIPATQISNIDIHSSNPIRNKGPTPPTPIHRKRPGYQRNRPNLSPTPPKSVSDNLRVPPEPKKTAI